MHYRRDGRAKRAYESVEQFRAMRERLDTEREGYDPDIHPYRCGFCGLIHGGHAPRVYVIEKRRFMEQEPMRSEIGMRTLAHLGAENHGDLERRRNAIGRRGRRVAA